MHIYTFILLSLLIVIIFLSIEILLNKYFNTEQIKQNINILIKELEKTYYKKYIKSTTNEKEKENLIQFLNNTEEIILNKNTSKNIKTKSFNYTIPIFLFTIFYLSYDNKEIFQYRLFFLSIAPSLIFILILTIILINNFRIINELQVKYNIKKRLIIGELKGWKNLY